MVFGVKNTSNTGNAVNVTSRAPAVPAGAAIDDIAIVFLDLWETSLNPTPTPPAGFTLLYSISGGTGSTGVKSRCYWKRLTAPDTGTYTFSWTGAMYATCHVILVEDAKTSGDPVGLNFASSWVGSTTNFPSVSVAPAYEPLLLWHGYNDSPSTHSPPTGYTELIDVDCATDAWRKPGVSGSATASGATSTVASARHASLIAVEPAVAAPPASGPILLEDGTRLILEDGTDSVRAEEDTELPLLTVFDAERGVDGNNVTLLTMPANSLALNTGSGGYFRHDAASAMYDNLAYRINVASAVGTSVRSYNMKTSKIQRVRFSFRLKSWTAPPTSRPILNFRNNVPAVAGRLIITSLREMKFQDASVTVPGAVPVLDIDTAEYDVSLLLQVGTTTSNGAVQLKIYERGTNTQVGSTATTSAADLGIQPISHLDFGTNDASTGALNYVIDGFRIENNVLTEFDPI